MAVEFQNGSRKAGHSIIKMGRNQIVILLYLHFPHPSMQSLSHKAPLQMSPLEPSDGSMVVHCSHLSADVSEDVAKIKYFLSHNRDNVLK